MLKTYFNHKKFNNDDKVSTVLNYYNELVYSMNIMIELREILDFNIMLSTSKTVEDSLRHLRLSLHKYVDCQQTFVFTVKNIYKKEKDYIF